MKGLQTSATLAAVASIFLFGCGCSFLKYFSSGPGDIAGKWTIPGQPTVVSFNKDMTYSIDQNGDGVNDVIGIYRTSIDWVALREDNASSESACAQDGDYSFAIHGRQLTLTIIADSCLERIPLLTNTSLVRQHIPRPVEPVKPPPPPPKINWTW